MPMRSFLFYLVFLVLPFASIAQVKLEGYGSIDIADLKNTTCEFSPGASALILIDACETTFEKGVHSLFYVHEKVRERIKILKEDGLAYASVKITSYSKNNYESLTNIKGASYNLDEAGKIIKTPLEKSTIFTKPGDANHSITSFAMPAVKIGTIIEYTYERVVKSYSNIKAWSFQSAIPTRISQYSIETPDFFVFMQDRTGSLPMDKKLKATSHNMITEDSRNLDYQCTLTTFTMQNIPPVPDEPFMASVEDYQEKIRFQLSRIVPQYGNDVGEEDTWGKLANSLMIDLDFGRQLDEELPLTYAHAPMSDYAKMCAVYEDVSKRLTWNDVYSIWSLQGVEDTWNKKSGSTGDINLLLLNRLKNAGLKAYPLLASTRKHGKITRTYPFLDQFNEVLAYVEIGQKQYVLDASYQNLVPGITPPNVANTQGLVVVRDNPYFISLSDSSCFARKSMVVTGSIDASGTLKADAVMKAYNYSGLQELREWKADKIAYQTAHYKTLTIDKMEVNPLPEGFPAMEEKFSFSLQPTVDGAYSFLPFNLLSEFSENPFLPESRKTNIDFNYKRQFSVMQLYQLPENYEVSNTPVRTQLILSDSSIVVKHTLLYDKQSLSIRTSIEFRKISYSKGEYPQLRDFYKKMFDLITAPIVLKKK
jgi:hypothetical protein